MRAGLALALAVVAAPALAVPPNPPGYGRIGKLVAQPGKSVPLIEALRTGARGMPGCISYTVAQDTANPDAVWVTEVWDRPESHRASLALPQVRAAISLGRPLVARFETIAVTAVALPPGTTASGC